MCDDGKALVLDLEKRWNGNQKDKNKKNLDRWLSACKDGENKIRKARKQFRQWHPLRVYVSVGNANLNTSVFSLRFFGQEVAWLIVKDNVILQITEKHMESNCKYFKNKLKEGKYLWDSKEAVKFRAFFKKLAIQSNGNPNVEIKEHRIESKFIEEMFNGRGKFGRPNLKIQPVTLGDCPLQFPVPFSANKGEIGKGRGNIDIITRRMGKDNKTRLSIWELKSPKEYKHAAYQAYIYAVQLLRILRSDNGKEWYRVFGFKRVLPRLLEIEAVVAIDRKHEDKFAKEKVKIGKYNKINGDVIKLYAVYYTEKPNSILLSDDNFQDD